MRRIRVSDIFDFLPGQTDLIRGRFCPRFCVCAACATAGPHKNLGSYTGERIASASLTYVQFIRSATLFLQR